MDQSSFGAKAVEPSTALQALVLIGKHHGLMFNAEELRRSNPFQSEEPSPDLLQRIAERIGFSVHRMRVRRGALDSLSRVVPAVLILKDGRFALMTRVQTGGGASFALIEDFDGGDGVSVLLDEPRLAQIWDGDALLFRRRWRLTDEDRPFNLAWIAGQVIREKRLFRDISVASFLISVLSIVPPLILMTLIDRVILNRGLGTLKVLALVLVLLIGFETAFAFLRRRVTALAVARIDARLLLYVYDKLLNLPLSYFERTSTGTVNSKLGQIWFIRNFLTEIVCGTLLDAVTLLVLIPVLFYLSWQLTLMVIVLALTIMTVFLLFLPSLARRHGAVVNAEHKMYSQQVETIYGIKTVKSLSLDGMKRAQRDERVAEVTDARRKLDFLTNVPQTMVLPLERLIYSGTFFVGCYLALTLPPSASITLGTIFAFALLANRATHPIVQFANLIHHYHHVRGALGEVASVVNNPPEEGRSGTGLRLPISGRVEFEEVRFRYSQTAKYALDGVSFEIPAGTIVGVMGRSGSGKTTVTRLLQGLSKDYDGLIKIDGMDLREIDLDHLRASIGVVPQENFLFSGTVSDNIRAGRPRATFEMVVRAAQMAGAEEFIERLANGYATVVEEGGVNFSGGQRQRLAIARALMVDPPILVLDEATSALDAESEAIVNANLRRIAKGRTVIIISHRLTSLIAADAILVMERGRLYDVGSHQELVDRCDIYKSLWYKQNRHLDPEGRYAVN